MDVRLVMRDDTAIILGRVLSCKGLATPRSQAGLTTVVLALHVIVHACITAGLSRISLSHNHLKHNHVPIHLGP